VGEESGFFHALPNRETPVLPRNASQLWVVGREKKMGPMVVISENRETSGANPD
jgi:hypothetical protein